MPKIEDELDTQGEVEVEGEQEEVEGSEQESDAQGDGEGNSESEADDNRGSTRKPFLEVDERTRYMTADEAKRGYQEAGKRIAALSAWEKELKEYGVTDPVEVRAYLDELLESRQTVDQLNRQLAQFKEERERQEKERTETSSRQSVEAKYTKEEREAVDWLKQQMPNLGYVPKEEAAKLAEALKQQTSRLDSLEEFRQQQEANYRLSLISDSQTKLSSWMKDDGYADNEEKSLQLLIEDSIKSWIEASDRRRERFYAGGSVKDDLIKEGYERAKVALGMLKSTSTNNYVKNKAEALKRNGKKLPAAEASSKPAKLGKPKKVVNSSGKRDYIGEKHNEAWEAFQRVTNRNEEQ